MSDVRLWTFAEYRIRDIVDVDLVSTTYRATTIDDDALCRLRVFTRESADDKSVVDVQDAVIAAALRARQVRHPNILNTHDAGRNDGRVYVVSDHINGSVLREFIARNRLVEPDTAVAMGWRLAEALDAVHAGGIVHGTINPHTIWVADSTGRELPMTYLTGFGAARALEREVKIQGGNPASDDLLYVEPHQVPRPHPSPEADRFALACAVYHLITGVPPFRRGTADGADGAQASSRIDPPGTVRHGLPRALDGVFARAFSQETSERHPSAYALMTAVERALRERSSGDTPGPAKWSGGASERDVVRAAFDATDADAITAALAAGDDADEATTDEEEETTDRLDVVAAGTSSGTGDGDNAPSRSVVGSESSAGADVASAVGAQADPTIDVGPDPSSEAEQAPEADPASGAETDPSETGSGSHSVPWVDADPGSPSVADGARPSAADLARALSRIADGGWSSSRPEEIDMLPRPDRLDRVSSRSDEADRPSPPDDVDGSSWSDEANGSSRSDDGDRLSSRSDEAGKTSQTEEVDRPPPLILDLEWSMPDDTRPSSRAPDVDRKPPLDPPAPNSLGAAGVEARRAAREHSREEFPRVALPPRPSATAPESLVRRFAVVLDFLKAHRGVVLLALSTLATVGIVATALAMRYSGPAEQGVAAVTGPQGQEEPADGPGVVHPAWTTPVESQPIRSIEVSRDVLLAATDTAVAAIDPTNGGLLWTGEPGVEVRAAAMVRSVAVAATVDGVFGYDLVSGRQRWTLSSEQPEALVAGAREIYAAQRDDLGGIALSAITPTGSVESLGTVPDEGVAGDDARGRLALAFETGGTRGDPTLYLLTRSALHAFDLETETVRWRAPVDDGGSDGTPRMRARPWVESLAAAGGAALVADRDGGICRYAGDSGEQVWTECQDLPAVVDAAPEIHIRGGRVVAGSGDALAAYNFTNGRPLWMQSSEGAGHAGVASGPETAFIAYAGGGLEALDHASGRRQWRAPDVGDAEVMAAGREGVFVGGRDGTISLVRQPVTADSDAP